MWSENNTDISKFWPSPLVQWTVVRCICPLADPGEGGTIRMPLLVQFHSFWQIICLTISWHSPSGIDPPPPKKFCQFTLLRTGSFTRTVSISVSVKLLSLCEWRRAILLQNGFHTHSTRRWPVSIDTMINNLTETETVRVNEPNKLIFIDHCLVIHVKMTFLSNGLFPLSDLDFDSDSDTDSCTMQDFSLGMDLDSDPLIEMYLTGAEICPWYRDPSLQWAQYPLGKWFKSEFESVCAVETFSA